MDFGKQIYRDTYTHNRTYQMYFKIRAVFISETNAQSFNTRISISVYKIHLCLQHSYMHNAGY